MQHLTRLKASETKKILTTLAETYGIKKLKLPNVLYRNTKGRLFLMSTAIDTIPLKHLRINNLGLYFANQSDSGLRLTIEGSQLIGPQATQNVITITDEEATEWMRGEPLNRTITQNDFVMIKHHDDYYGCGRKSGDIIANFLPKSRRIKSYKTPEILE